MPIRRAKRLTLKEVARQIGVSTATVSNAFNRPSQLSEGLREDILQSCKQIGYAGPHATSRKLRSRKTKIIAVVLSPKLSSSFSNPTTNLILQGISEVCEEHEYNILVVPSTLDSRGLVGLMSFVEGFIIYGATSKHIVNELVYNRKSIVSIDFNYENGVSINIDHHKAAKECANLAFSHQPECTAVIGVNLSIEHKTVSLEHAALDNPLNNNMVQKLSGYKEAARAHNIIISNSNIWSIPENTALYAYETAKYLLLRSPRPRLILCMNDTIALNAVRAANDLGLSVPEDLLITGFDGIDEARTSSPSLTTIEQPSVGKGRLAAQVLIGQRPEENILLDAHLVIRDSCPEKLI